MIASSDPSLNIVLSRDHLAGDYFAYILVRLYRIGVFCSLFSPSVAI